MVEFLEPKDVYVGELAERGEWIVANVESSIGWPTKAQKLKYRGFTLWIIPVMRKYYPAVAMKRPKDMSRQDCERLIMRFLSALSWIEERGALVEHFTGGSMAAPMGRDKESGFAICDEFDLPYLPEPTDEKALLALGLMREGRGLNHAGYAFLSFYRVLEVAIPNSKRRQQWVKDHLDTLNDRRAKEALNALKTQGISDIAAHLYESGRCAIAHGRQKPVIDADDPTDLRRLSGELPIMSELASRAIEEELNIETGHTVWKKHLYELAGFKEILGSDLIERVTRGERITDGRMVDIPCLRVEIRRKKPYPPFAKLAPVDIGQDGSLIWLMIQSEDKRATFRFRLDFKGERLLFDIENDFWMFDDGSAEGADALAEISRFMKDYWGNGQLQIVNTETGDLLSRKGAFIPVNRFLDHKAANAEIERWQRAASGRRARNEEYGKELQSWLSPRWAVEIKVTW